jgi:hypothetical protein
MYCSTEAYIFNNLEAWSCKEEVEPVLRIRIRIEFGCLDPDQDPGGQKWPPKKNFKF